MKKLMMLVVAGMFSVSTAAYACDGKDHAAKAEKSGKVVKKDSKENTQAKDQKKS
jgi:hypothetical protein